MSRGIEVVAQYLCPISSDISIMLSRLTSMLTHALHRIRSHHPVNPESTSPSSPNLLHPLVLLPRARPNHLPDLLIVIYVTSPRRGWREEVVHARHTDVVSTIHLVGRKGGGRLADAFA